MAREAMSEYEESVKLAFDTKIDQPSHDAVLGRASEVLRPPAAFESLDRVAGWLAGWQRTPEPGVANPGVLIFGADHGVASRGVSAFPSEITGAMAAAIGARVATSSALAKAAGAGLRFIDVGVGQPTEDFTIADALSPERFGEAWEAGVDAVRRSEHDLIILGELGIGNTTAAAAVCAGLFGSGGAAWAGRGTGVDDEGLAVKIGVVDDGLARIGAETAPLEILRRVGGAELVAMAGAATEARLRSIPLVLDGFIATAALMPLHQLQPGFLDHSIAGHSSAEGGHARLLEILDKSPLLALDLRLGEASGALVALPLLNQAVAAVLDVSTFAEFGIG